ncbi:MAG TPA: nitroreductase family deazaflavin-dependent oxidoreductase [Egibacteraceae bacterium]|nr:nitroreductase family deazaflavin-dependent oxidoreductase [Egibacteraceae bacterium]
MGRRYRLGVLRRLGNLFMSVAVLLGLPRSTVLLETVGARTGRVRRTPVNVLRLDDERWLVAPYGLVGWVHNVRAAPAATLRRGLVGEPVRLEPADDDVAGPVLKAYWEAFPITRPFFDAGEDAPPEAFAGEAARHPVFRVVAADPAGKRAI